MTKKVIEGEVILTVQTDEQTYHVDYPDVTNEETNLTEILEDHFMGKKVRITIEEIIE
ncbi:hypothetical protein [Rossellomorea marisflavi]|uniref:hypothetical protein n=1 Tax=Rossellomorea marisflavi TaxID=189381 RepID=UPI00345D1213